jgi:hypothetical protein
MHTSLYSGGFLNKNRISDIAVNAHALWQMSGLCLKYYAEHVKTDYYVKAKIGAKWINQNLEVTKYQFNFNNDCIEYTKDNNNGVNFTKNQAIENIRSNIKSFLDNPDLKILNGGKSFKKNITKRKTNRKSKRKTRKIRSRN